MSGSDAEDLSERPCSPCAREDASDYSCIARPVSDIHQSTGPNALCRQKRRGVSNRGSHAKGDIANRNARLDVAARKLGITPNGGSELTDARDGETAP